MVKAYDEIYPEIGQILLDVNDFKYLCLGYTANDCIVALWLVTYDSFDSVEKYHEYLDYCIMNRMKSPIYRENLCILKLLYLFKYKVYEGYTFCNADKLLSWYAKSAVMTNGNFDNLYSCKEYRKRCKDNAW